MGPKVRHKQQRPAAIQTVMLRYNISDTAVARVKRHFTYRDRTELKNDDDIRKVIDKLAYDAIAGSKYEHIVDAGKESMLVDIGDRWPDLFAVVRDDDKFSTPDNRRQVIVTIIDKETVNVNKSSGEWRWKHRMSPGTPFNSLGDKLKQAVPAIPVGPVPKIEVSKDATPAKPVPLEKVTVTGEEVPESSRRRVTWIGEDEEEYSEIMQKAVVSSFVNKLVVEDGVDPADIEVFKEVYKPEWVKTALRLKVQVDED